MRREIGPRRMVVRLEERWDAWRVARRSGRPPEYFRIIPYAGHGSGSTAVVRGRVLDNPKPKEATEGEGVWAAARRTIARFNTIELPAVPLQVSVGNHRVDTETDNEGYFEVRLETGSARTDNGWVEGEVELIGPYRDLTGGHEVGFLIRVPVSEATFGIISDVNDTILHSGTQSPLSVLRTTLTGSELTRTPVAGAAELWRGLAAGETGPDENPVFYLSSSPWNLYGFLTAFIEHRGFPRGPLLLRDLLGGDYERSHHSHESERIDEVLELHPQLRFVLLGDSAQDDAHIYQSIRKLLRRPLLYLLIVSPTCRRDQRTSAQCGAGLGCLVVSAVRHGAECPADFSTRRGQRADELSQESLANRLEVVEGRHAWLG